MPEITIDSKTLTFLSNLKKNNTREWFSNHREDYESAWNNIKNFGNALMELMNTHDVIEGVKFFRIYRDIRFSKDKTPYKNNLGLGLRRAGVDKRGGYYLHIEPDQKSMLACGFWGPEAQDLARIRKEIDLDGNTFQEIIQNPKIQATFGNMKGDQLKTTPKGYPKDHLFIHLLRFKQFIFTKSFSDQEVLRNDFLHKINLHFKAIRPFFDYMSEILTTDPNGEKTI